MIIQRQQVICLGKVREMNYVRHTCHIVKVLPNGRFEGWVWPYCKSGPKCKVSNDEGGHIVKVVPNASLQNYEGGHLVVLIQIQGSNGWK